MSADSLSDRPGKSEQGETIDLMNEAERLLTQAQEVYWGLKTLRDRCYSHQHREDGTGYEESVWSGIREGVQFSRGQAEDVVGGLGRVSSRFRDYLNMARRKSDQAASDETEAR